MSTKPDFFIIGAPKCGTTSLAAYLGEHSAVHMSVPKEPHYFCEDFPGIRWTTDLADYESLFDTSKPGVRSRGEASVWYLYSREAIARIRDYRPDAKLLVLLRNPADMVYSLYGQYLFNPIEDELDFAKAWDLSDCRRKGLRVPRLCPARQLLYYDEVAYYGEQLARVYQHFPREQVLVLWYDDLCVAPARVYRIALDFLGLPFDGRCEFPVINAYRTVHSRWLQAGLREAWDLLHKTRMRVQACTGVDLSRFGLHRPLTNALAGMNVKASRRVPLPDEMRRTILEHYRADIGLLSELTGRSLRNWLEAA